MSGWEAKILFKSLRWTEGKPVCIHCECPNVYKCRKDLSLSSGTLFVVHKLPLQTYLASVAIFIN